MQGDPKNPNAWWAVQKLPLREIWTGRVSKRQLIWLIPLFLLIVSVEIFYMIKLTR